MIFLEDAFNKFIKLRWSSSEGSTILRGNVQLSDDKLNVHVNSEAYYFFYARVSFMHRERDIYRYGIVLILRYISCIIVQVCFAMHYVPF